MIGILTFHRGPNYGGFLQAWHLRRAIADLGFPVTVINYQNIDHAKYERIPFPSCSFQGLKTFGHKYLKAKPFSRCVTALSDQPFATNPNKIPWERFSTVVVGSDVIWDYSNPAFGHDPAFFGALPIQKDPRFVSYAASCGMTDGSAAAPEYVNQGLKRFSTHLVRDENTATLVEWATGQTPPLVVDPTWLQDDPGIRRRIAPSAPYVLLYGGGLDSERAKALRRYCDRNGLKLVSASTPCRVADKVFRSIDPFEWVDLFRHAKAVVTSTLHGTLYTIKYGKPLLLMNNLQSDNKARTVIARCGLQASVVAHGQPFAPTLLEALLSPQSAVRPPAGWIGDSRKALAAALA